MILKSFELNKIDLKKNKIILLYGKNEGHKNEVISAITKKNKNISNYDEKEILDNTTQFLESLFNQSLFDNEKYIIIKRGTDKLLKIIEQINQKKIDQITILINSDSLEKKSKLRILFEKSKENLCIPFYPDNSQTLSKITSDYLSSKKIQMSQININLIVSKCNGDREKLFNELNKIEYYSLNGKKLDNHNISKLINLSENHSVSELIDNCLAKNNKKIIHILNENNFGTDDTILIVRTFLNKSKRILKLREDFEKNQNIETTISTAKPPIFWKDKEITKSQINKWTSKKLKELVFKLGEIELLIKKKI